MDSRCFDGIVRRLAASDSRRATLRVMAGATVAAGFARLGPGAAVAHEPAACKPVGKTCDKNQQCCSKLCKGKKCRCRALQAPCADSVDCCNGMVCLTSNGCGTEKRCRRKNGETCASKCNCATGIQCVGGKCCNPAGAPCLILGQPQLCCPGLVCNQTTHKCESS